MASPGQPGFFDNNQSKSAEILIKDNHELVILSDSIDWTEQISAAHYIRASKVKVLCGPEPRYRELLGAITLTAVRNITYHQTEDLIAHYAPARYLCGLIDSTWRPDHVTIFECTQMMGPEGMDILNRNALLRAQSIGILDASRLMSDTTAQEAMIPYPNEVGLIEQTGCEKHTGNGNLWASLILGHESHENGSRADGFANATHIELTDRQRAEEVTMRYPHQTAE